MEQLDRAGIATFVMRDKEYLVAILAENGILRAEALRFADELRVPEDVGLPEAPRVTAAAVKRFETQIRKLKAKTFDPDELHDRAAERLTELIAHKQQQGEDVRISGEPGAEPPSDIIDLMAALKRSLTGDGGGERQAPERTRAKRSNGGRSASKAGGGGASKSARRSAAKSAGSELSALSKEELYERAQQLDIPGRSAMSKRELISALEQA
jgi:DNA end-binding protein Ku